MQRAGKIEQEVEALDLWRCEQEAAQATEDA